MLSMVARIDGISLASLMRIWKGEAGVRLNGLVFHGDVDRKVGVRLSSEFIMRMERTLVKILCGIPVA